MRPHASSKRLDSARLAKEVVDHVLIELIITEVLFAAFESKFRGLNEL